MIFEQKKVQNWVQIKVQYVRTREAFARLKKVQKCKETCANGENAYISAIRFLSILFPKNHHYPSFQGDNSIGPR